MPPETKIQLSELKQNLSRVVYYQIFDFKDGQPYVTLEPDCVRLQLDATALELRKAVKADYNSPELLGDYQPLSLKIFKNKSDFNRRLDLENIGPLSMNHPLTDLGLDENQPIIVTVPSKYPICQNDFFNNIDKAIQKDEWLTFDYNIPFSAQNIMYIRESYRIISQQISTGDCKAVITGTPGIGKSLFLIYLLFKLVKEKNRVLFIYHPYLIYYDNYGNVFRFAPDQLPKINDENFWNETLWCLFDAKDKKEGDLQIIPYSDCNMIVFTSSKRGLLNDFVKPPRPQIYFMPTWMEDELKLIAPTFPASINWRERYCVLGGIPRFVLDDIKDEEKSILIQACRKCDLDDCIKVIGFDSETTGKSMIVHSLIHITSLPPYTNSSVVYASQTAIDIIIQEKGAKAKLRMRELLESCYGNPLTAALCGYIFEPYAFEVLEKGGQFKIRQLFHGNKKEKLNEQTLEIPPSIRQITNEMSNGQTVHQLYLPKNKNHTAVDAWMPGIGAFQMTVGKSHELKGDLQKELETLGPGAQKLFWLLPPLHFHSFTKKNPQKIDQYALLIPYPQYS